MSSRSPNNESRITDLLCTIARSLLRYRMVLDSGNDGSEIQLSNNFDINSLVTL